MSGWNGAKVDAFKTAFYEFINYLPMDSKDLGGGAILGKHLFRSQIMLFDAIWEALSDDIHEIDIVKARQLGISTGGRALDLFWTGMHDGLRGGIVFDTAFNTQQARREILAMIRALPARFRFPRIREDNRDNLILENGSALLFMSAGRSQTKTGGSLGRSVGLNFAHMSELSSFVNEEGVISFEQSLSQTFENRLYLKESTCRGYNLWHSMIEEAHNDDLRKRVFFIGWWTKDNQELRPGTREYERYATPPPTKREAERIRAVKEQYGWDITRGQLGWYRQLVDPSQERNDDEFVDPILTQEQPWTEEEAFQQTGSTFFPADALTLASNRIAAQPRPQTYHFFAGNEFTSCMINPSRSRRETDLWVWEEPVANGVYIVSGDPAFGRDEHNNHSAVTVLRCYADGADQVAEYASGLCPPHHFAWLLLSLVGWYAGSKPGAKALMICELNGPGEEVWRQYQASLLLVQRGYLRRQAEEKGIGDLYANARSYIYNRSDSMAGGHNYQFKTTIQLKVQIMEACRNYLQSGSLVVNSWGLLEEMRSISRDGDTIGAEGRNRDDRTFALAMAVRAWDEKMRRGMILANQTRQAERARLSMSIADQAQLWNTNTLRYFFEQKERARRQLGLTARQQALHRLARQQRQWRR